jgi:hypothetical protein
MKKNVLNLTLQLKKFGVSKSYFKNDNKMNKTYYHFYK